MIWFLLAAGLLLIVLGVWGGPATRRRPDKSERIPREATVQEAWDILTSPVQYDDELIKIPDHRPWFLPGGDRRFQRGLLVGFGAGLLLSALLLPLIAPPAAPVSPEPGQEPGVVLGPGRQDPGAANPGGQNPGGTGSEPSTEPVLPPTAEPGSGEEEPPAPPETQPGPESEPGRPATVSVTVEMGSSSQDIAALLREAGLIGEEEEFLAVVRELGVETQLQAGTFDIPSDASPVEIVNILTH